MKTRYPVLQRITLHKARTKQLRDHRLLTQTSSATGLHRLQSTLATRATTPSQTISLPLTALPSINDAHNPHAPIARQLTLLCLTTARASFGDSPQSRTGRPQSSTRAPCANLAGAHHGRESPPISACQTSGSHAHSLLNWDEVVVCHVSTSIQPKWIPSGGRLSFTFCCLTNTSRRPVRSWISIGLSFRCTRKTRFRLSTTS